MSRPFGSRPADGAYDGDAVYRAASVRRAGPPPDVVVPPRSSAVASTDDRAAQTPGDRHIRLVAEKDGMVWKRANGYGRRNLVEIAISRDKHLIGAKLCARTLIARRGAAALAIAVFNRTAKDRQAFVFGPGLTARVKWVSLGLW